MEVDEEVGEVKVSDGLCVGRGSRGGERSIEGVGEVFLEKILRKCKVKTATIKCCGTPERLKVRVLVLSTTSSEFVEEH